MKRWKLTLEYDGSAFHGWQRQEERLITVQSALESAIYAMCQQNILICAAGRTDTGVHAHGQVAHFDLDYGDRAITGYSLAKALNALIRPYPIAILKAEEVAPDFHARFHAKSKLYIYRCAQRSSPPLMERGKIWHVKKKWNIDAVKEGLQHLIGHHDFTSFRASECQAKHPHRTLDKASIHVKDYDQHGGKEIQFHFEAQSFLHHQVRNMVGTLSLVGEGKWHPDEVKTALLAKDRAKAGPTAPPDGLSLMRIDY